MEFKKQDKDLSLLQRLGGVSLQVAHNHHLDNLSEFVLHDLCSQDLFRVIKAAYLVNNPDFNCMKGVAGYSKHESFKIGNNWHNQKEFTAHMQNSGFNQKVRRIADLNALKLSDNLDKNYLYKLSDQLEIEYPEFHMWNMKYDNQGLLIFQKEDHDDAMFDHLGHFTSMLSFCPVF